MSMQRWDPFDEMLSLRDAMDRLVQESFVRPAGSFFMGARGSLPLDLAEDENSYTVSATMPGINPEDVQISVHGNTLTIRGENRAEEKQERRNYIMRERHAVSFHRSLTLPGPVNVDAAEAHYENGVLTLMLPKAEAARPRQIKVRDSQNQGQLPVSGQSAASDQGGAGATPSVGQGANKQASDQAIPMPPAHHSTESADTVGRASEQTFPASDAPSYSHGPA